MKGYSWSLTIRLLNVISWRFWGGEILPSEEKQSVYSTAPADWTRYFPVIGIYILEKTKQTNKQINNIKYLVYFVKHWINYAVGSGLPNAHGFISVKRIDIGATSVFFLNFKDPSMSHLSVYSHQATASIRQNTVITRFF